MSLYYLIIISIINNSINNNKNIFFFNRNEIINSLNLTNNLEDENKILKAEEIFISYEIISFAVLFFGCFIILYGSYYYKLALMIHSGLFIYYIIGLIYFKETVYYLYFGLFSLISGILIYVFISTDDIKSLKYKVQKFIYGIGCGCFLYKTMFYYIAIYPDNNSIIYYYISFFFVILIIGIINYFIPNNLVYLPCSVVSGSFYIINNLNNIICKETLENKKETFDKNSLIIHIIIFIFSIFYQIYHLKYKNNELPNNYNNEKDDNENENERMSTASNKLNIEIADKQQELLNDNKNEENIEEEEINDQED